MVILKSGAEKGIKENLESQNSTCRYIFKADSNQRIIGKTKSLFGNFYAFIILQYKDIIMTII